MKNRFVIGEREEAEPMSEVLQKRSVREVIHSFITPHQNLKSNHFKFDFDKTKGFESPKQNLNHIMYGELVL